MNFTDWLHQVRINNAILLMKTSDLPITRIAHEVGFVKMTSFGKAFKKYELMTPKEFKNSLRPH